MKNKTMIKLNIKRRMTALMLVLLMGVMGLSLTGCGGGSVDLEKGGRSDVTLSQALEANPDAAWFKVKSIDKDANVDQVYYFENGQVTHYDISTAGIKLGQIGDMSREDIIAASVKSWEDTIERHIDDWEQDPILNEAWANFKESVKLPDDTSPALPYTLEFYTDGSGNYVETERLVIPYMFTEDATDHDVFMVYYGLGDGIILTEDTISFKFTYGGYMGQVYDIDYGGFVTEKGNMFITKASPDTTLVLDELGTEGIAVDPQD